MAKIYLIPISYIKEYSILDDNIDDKTIKTSILDAQEQYLEPILGTKLYDKLLSDTENGILHSNYQTLIQSKIWPYMLHAVCYKVALNLIYRVTNTSVVKDQNQTSTPISLQELNVMREERLQGMKYTEKKLRLYLQNNTTMFPEYYDIDIEGVQASATKQPRNFYADLGENYDINDKSTWQ